MTEPTKRGRGRLPGPAGLKAKTIVVLHEGSLWEFAPGTRVRRVILAGKKWLVIAPATSAPPFLIDNTGTKRTVQPDLHDVLVKLATAEMTVDDLG
ncbi:hypothetical protein [Pseudoclavibacter sp. Z016]|uniref:hypothetical protein n=1 Tax=Pseudoclavibacter sp. Z016 TaxID=2080581 RepID=UPI000CE75D43|nr:hypothetical protein [Pseudoclavibacter sp. Z016]PPF73382.1 hypothetical protein C5B99_15530 [Pseudoclavibacter sp. Z016]